jgi:hypothetical protein
MAMEKKCQKPTPEKRGDTNLKSASNASFFRILFFVYDEKFIQKKYVK